MGVVNSTLNNKFIVYILYNMAQVQLWYNPEKNYQLPAPIREYKGKSGKTMDDATSFEWDNFAARVPLVDQQLIDDWVLFVEYGRLKPIHNKWNQNNGRRAWGISFWSTWVWATQVTGRWYSAWWHVGLWWQVRNTDAPNLYPVTVQGDTAFNVPYEAFYRLKDVEYFDETIPSWVAFLSPWMPHMKWGRYRRIWKTSWAITPNKRYQWNQIKTQLHTKSEWYARLVVIKDNKVVQQWPISEPLYISWEWWPLYWDERNRTYNINSNPFIAHWTIENKYKQ